MTRTIPVATAALVLLALVGCASAASTETPPSASPSAAEASAEPSASPEPERVDTSDWIEYASNDRELAFRYPSDWTIETMTTPPIAGVGRDGAREMDSAELTASNGQLLLATYDVVDMGGACGDAESFQPVEILATEPLTASEDTSIVTAALRSVEGRWMFGMGLVSGDVPTMDTCVFHFVAGSSEGGFVLGTLPDLVSSGDDPLWTVDSLDDARDYMETDEYATILEVLRSVRTS